MASERVRWIVPLLESSLFPSLGLRRTQLLVSPRVVIVSPRWVDTCQFEKILHFVLITVAVGVVREHPQFWYCEPPSPILHQAVDPRVVDAPVVEISVSVWEEL